MPKVAIMNRCTVVPDADIQTAVAALQIQVDRDFQPIWGGRADLTFVKKSGKAPSGSWQLGVFDTSDQADALGYHDVTSTGAPLGKAFAKSDIDGGYIWSITLSHELLELLADPEINLSAMSGNNIWAYEICDPCEADALGYAVIGVMVSDFVTPAWFSPTTKVKGPFDFQKKISQPLQVVAGGYAQYLDLTKPDGWHQVNASKALNKNRAPVGSRRERRRIGRDEWRASTQTG